MVVMLGIALSEVRGLLNDLLEKLSGRDGEKWLTELKKFLRGESCWVSKPNPYLRKITEGVLGATTGERTLAKAGELFSASLDSDFAYWGTDVVGPATEEAPFEVFEMVKDGTFEQVFGAFGVDRKKLCWSQDQITTFVEAHESLLHPDGWATFFLFSVKLEEGTENEHEEEFFVVDVCRRDVGQLRADAYRLSNDFVWLAESRNRFVVPQLAL